MISHNYLGRKTGDTDVILEKIRAVANRGDFTLGSEVGEFEAAFATLCGARHAVGVANGTDALFLTMRAFGVGRGDEVITSAQTFYATVGAIVQAGATPVLADIGDDYNIDPEKALEALTPRAKAIVPVAWAGLPPAPLFPLSHSDVVIIEDACQAVGSTRNAHAPNARCYSLHPLKNLHIWGDGGVIVTDDERLDARLRLARNHGLSGRDTWAEMGVNSRLDTIQAVVGLNYLPSVQEVTRLRQLNAKFYDEMLSEIEQVEVPQRSPSGNFHLYIVECGRRDELVAYLNERGVEAKVHYPVPLHTQPAMAQYGYKLGDFPRAERYCERAITLPIHEYLTIGELTEVAERIRDFYR